MLRPSWPMRARWVTIYLKYQNRRAEYVKNFFNIINWDDVAMRYEKARG
jgi:superoxide dismutase